MESQPARVVRRLSRHASASLAETKRAFPEVSTRDQQAPQHHPLPCPHSMTLLSDTTTPQPSSTNIPTSERQRTSTANECTLPCQQTTPRQLSVAPRSDLTPDLAVSCKQVRLIPASCRKRSRPCIHTFKEAYRSRRHHEFSKEAHRDRCRLSRNIVTKAMRPRANSVRFPPNIGHEVSLTRFSLATDY